MSRLLCRARARWSAAVVVLLLLSWGQRLPAQEFVYNGYKVTAVSYSDDGKQLAAAVANYDNFSATSVCRVALLSLKRPEGGGVQPPPPQPTLSTGTFNENGERRISLLAVSPDGRTWATLYQGKIDLWDGITTKLMAPVPLGAKDDVTQLFFLDRRTLLICGATMSESKKVGMVRLWDTKANEKSSEFNPPTRVAGIHLAPDHTTLLLCDGEDTVRTCTVKKKDDKYELEEKSALKGHKGMVCAALTADGKKMLTGGTDKKVRLWDVEKSKEITFLAGHADTVAWVAFSSNGAPISWSLDGTARLWDVEADKEARVWKEEGYLAAFAVSPDGTKLASGGANGAIVWDIAKMVKEDKKPDKPK